MAKSPRYNVSSDEDKIADFSKVLILICMHEKDELDTRVALYREIGIFKKRHDTPKEIKILEEIKDRFDAMTFDELKEYYDKCRHVDDKIDETTVNWTKDEEEVKMAKETYDGPLFRQLFVSKANKDFNLYLEGTDNRSYRKIRTFQFEDEYYVYLKAGSDDVTRCYKYVLDKKENEWGEVEDIEKLIYIDDEQLLKLFEFLKL